jgi:hypothetical protein
MTRVEATYLLLGVDEEKKSLLGSGSPILELQQQRKKNMKEKNRNE